MNRPASLSTLLPLIALATITPAWAQFTIDWQTMDGGGGSGVAGTFAMDGTLGQFDATAGAAESIAFRGGYWALVDEPLPLLRIFEFKGEIILAWPDPSPGFTLQATPELIDPDWEDVLDVPAVVSGEKQVIWGTPTGRHFFRLHRP